VIERRISALLIIAFGALALYDLTLEWGRADLVHIAAEFLVCLLAWVWGLHLLRKSWRLKDELAKFAQGLSDAIDKQFTLWQLTPAEKDVALLILKGLDFKLIADVRKTSERTARQQALSIYQKSGLAGRNELTAFFLEDLLGPPTSSSK